MLNFLFSAESPGDAARYSKEPVFALDKDYFVDFFNYHFYQLKTTNPIYALYFIGLVIILAVIGCVFYFGGPTFANNLVTSARRAASSSFGSLAAQATTQMMRRNN
jgi:hypothetical protein